MNSVSMALKALRTQLELPSLQAHMMTLRDERGWRVNERMIEYTWVVGIHHAFGGTVWLFSVKFAATPFQEINNPEQLLQGLMKINEVGQVISFYTHQDLDQFDDPIRRLKIDDLFEASRGITLDGVHYNYAIFAPSTSIEISINNPNSKHWKIWEEEVWNLGKKLADAAAIMDFQSFFG